MKAVRDNRQLRSFKLGVAGQTLYDVIVNFELRFSDIVHLFVSSSGLPTTYSTRLAGFLKKVHAIPDNRWQCCGVLQTKSDSMAFRACNTISSLPMTLVRPIYPTELVWAYANTSAVSTIKQL